MLGSLRTQNDLVVVVLSSFVAECVSSPPAFAGLPDRIRVTLCVFMFTLLIVNPFNMLIRSSVSSGSDTALKSRGGPSRTLQSQEASGQSSDCSTPNRANRLCGSVAEWLGRWTCDQQVAGSNPGLSAVQCNPGQVVSTHVPLIPSSIIWFQPMGSDALQLGR